MQLWPRRRTRPPPYIPYSYGPCSFWTRATSKDLRGRAASALDGSGLAAAQRDGRHPRPAHRDGHLGARRETRLGGALARDFERELVDAEDREEPDARAKKTIGPRWPWPEWAMGQVVLVPRSCGPRTKKTNLRELERKVHARLQRAPKSVLTTRDRQKLRTCLPPNSHNYIAHNYLGHNYITCLLPNSHFTRTPTLIGF